MEEMNDHLAGDLSNLNSLGLVFMLLMAILIVFLPRRVALLPLLLTICYIPLGQRLVIGGAHFTLIRILMAIGVLRTWFRRESAAFRFNHLDRLFFTWVAASFFLGILCEMSGAGMMNRSGFAYDALGAYLLIRPLLMNMDDVAVFLRTLALALVPLALSMAIEKFTAHNLFSIFGGVSAITEVRDGHLRCQGAFRHPILAGTFAATLSPLFIGLWQQNPVHRGRAAIGFCACAFITFAATSSGALLALLAGMAGIGMWPLRDHLSLIRRGFVVLIILLAMVMKAPVWYLIARVSEITGGTGWHRSYLIDQAVKHFSEWWLVGSNYTAHWGPAGQVLAVDPNNMDITNQFVSEGLKGGMLKLILFVAMIVSSFKRLGFTLHECVFESEGDRKFFWAMGACLFAHCVSFISISYFDQTVVSYYLVIAIIAGLTISKNEAGFEFAENQSWTEEAVVGLGSV